MPYYRIDSFYEDESGTFWVASFVGLGRFDRTTGRLLAYRPNPKDPAGFVDTDLRSLCVDATAGLLWVSAWGNGVSALDRSTGHFTRYKNIPKDPYSLSNNDVVDIFQDRKGNLWFSTLGGLNRFDPKTRRFIRYLHDAGNRGSLSDDSVAKTYEDRAGRFWVATNNGLNLMDRTRGTFTRYLNDPSDSFSLSSNVINDRALYEDASGALWIGMRSTGVERWAGVAERFITYRHNSQNANSPSNNAITGLAIGSEGALWIGTEAGLDRFDGRTFTHYISDPNDPSRLSPGPERLVAQDSHGAVWTGTYGGGLDRLNGQHVTHFRHDPRNSDTPANNNIGGLVPDAGEGLWIGVHGKGMDYFDGRHFTHFPPDPANPAGLPDAFVRPLLLDRYGMLWSCSDNSGLVRFDTHTRTFTTYLMDPNQPGSQGANWTGHVYSDGASLWVGSPKGLFRFDPEAGTFTRHYTEKDGLASNSVVAVQGDAQGNIWVSTIKGLSRFDPKTGIFRNYDVFDGLQGNDFFPRCSAKMPDGRLFFGGVNGLSAFFPDQLADNLIPPRVVLTEFELFNKPVRVGGQGSPLRKSINVASSISLRYDQSVFRFQFAALNFTAPQKNGYAYRLDGFDRDWQYTEASRRFATYTNLAPGGYTFRVKASNNDGIWNEQGVALHLTIVPPWWKTSWFWAICVGATLALLWLLYRLRVQQLAREFNAHLEGRVDERLHVARDLHDTLLQSFQALIPIFQTARTLLPARPDRAAEVLDDGLKEARDAIVEGRNAIQELRGSSPEDLTSLLTATGQELARSPGSNSSTPAFRVMVEGSRRPLTPLLQDDIYRIGREALRNAFRHAHADQIEVEIRYDHAIFRLRIRDDGKGIDSSVLEEGARPGHWGLPGMVERAKGIGGRLKVWSEAGAGSEVELTVPARIAYAKSAPKDG